MGQFAPLLGTCTGARVSAPHGWPYCAHHLMVPPAAAAARPIHRGLPERESTGKCGGFTKMVPVFRIIVLRRRLFGRKSLEYCPGIICSHVRSLDAGVEVLDRPVRTRVEERPYPAITGTTKPRQTHRFLTEQRGNRQ